MKKKNFSKSREFIREFYPLVLGFALVFLLYIYGIWIYMYLEKWNFIESFYQVVITLSTVGFGEIRPLSQEARFHTSILILLGVGAYAYIIGSFSSAFMEGKIRFFWGKKAMEKKISCLKNHFIICGYGRIGSIVAKELLREGVDVVVIENAGEKINQLNENKILYLEGDATDDRILTKAGINKAKAIITALTTDAQNVYVTLSARQLNPNVTIVARAENEDSIKKLEFAGANRALTPHYLGGLRMAQMVLRPTVISFLDMAIHGDDLNLQMEEIYIPQNSQIAGKNLIEAELRPKFNLIIIAIKKPSGEMIYNPQAGEILQEGDTLIVIGRKRDLQNFKEIV